MLKNGDILYFEEEGHIFSGKVKNLAKETFEIEGYGCCCEDGCAISRSMIGYTFFLDRSELDRRIARQ